jgi:hypothetical protein
VPASGSIPRSTLSDDPDRAAYSALRKLSKWELWQIMYFEVDRPTRLGADHPGNGEIEVTPEMIEAGARELFLSLPVQDQVDLDGVAVSVFKAMILACSSTRKSESTVCAT